MKKIFIIAAGILVVTVLLGLWMQMAGASIDTVPAKKMAGKLGLPQIFWPFALPGFGAIVMLASGLSKYETILQKLNSNDLGKSDFIIGLSLLFGPVLAFIMQGGMALYVFGLVDKGDLMKASVGLGLIFFLAMGNYIGTTQRGSPAGLRTPWSAHNDRIWFKTQRFLGRGLVLLSLSGITMLFFDDPMGVMWKFFAALVSLKVLAVSYSYFLWRNEKRQPDLIPKSN